MIEKYILMVEDIPVAIKYNHRDYRLTIGSYSRWRETVERVLTSYFTEDVPRVRWPQKNKLKYECNIGVKRFCSGINEMRKHGFILESTKSLGRLIR